MATKNVLHTFDFGKLRIAVQSLSGEIFLQARIHEHKTPVEIPVTTWQALENSPSLRDLVAEAAVGAPSAFQVTDVITEVLSHPKVESELARSRY